MITYSETPTFNLKVVISQTGLKPDTIRAWERRYGLPAPQRTPGGHRLYSEGDIAALKWLMARTAEGLGISKAVRLWHQLVADGHDPLRAMPVRADRGPEEQPALRPGISLEEAREGWIAACLAFDEAAAERVVAEAFAEFPLETVCFSVLRAGLSAIGELWYSNRATVQQEHFASELAMRRLEALVAAVPPPHRDRKILVGCTTDEAHTFPPLLMTLLLRRRGWDVVYLGANVPLDRLETAVEQVKSNIVVLTAQHILSAAKLQKMGVSLQQAGIRMAYGGQIFNRLPDLRGRIPGEFLGEHLDRAVQQLERLLDSEPFVPQIPTLDTVIQAALDHFREREGSLANQIRRQLKESGMRPDDLQTANHFLGQGIAAALTLGDIAFLGEDLQWVGGLLTHFGVNHGSLKAFLGAYLQTAQDNLDERAAPILAWLERVSAEVPTNS